MSRMLKTLVLVITVIITEITCEEIHFKSCPIGDVNKKLQFSKATCDDCLQKSKGRVGNKCRFTGPPLLEPPPGVSPRAHTKKFVDLVNKMMKESASGVRFTYAELKRRLQDENIPVQKSNWALDDRTLQHWTKEPYVLPKISKAYINQRGPFLDPLEPQAFQCFSSDQQNKGNAEGDAALKGKALDKKGVTAIYRHDTKGTSKDYEEDGVVFEKSNDKNWECGLFAKARPAFLKWLQILKKARVLEEEQKVSERKVSDSPKTTKKVVSEQKVSDSTTTTTKTPKKVKTKNAEAFTKPSGSAYKAILSSSPGGIFPCSAKHTSNIEFLLRRELVSCKSSAEPGPVVDESDKCREKVSDRIKKFCGKSDSPDYAFDVMECFEKCVDLYAEKAVFSFTPPYLLN